MNSKKSRGATGLGVVFSCLAACQGPIGQDVGPVPPTVGSFPSTTHQSRLTLSGGKPANSSLFINGLEAVPADAAPTWSAAVVLPSEGSNVLEIQTLDDRGQISPTVLLSIIRDTVKPSPPDIDSVVSSVAANPVAISGTKESGSLVRLNGRRIVPASAATTWVYQATLLPGENTLRLTVIDRAGNESDPRPITTTLTSSCTAPRPIFPLDRGEIAWGSRFMWQAPPTPASGGYRFELSSSPAFAFDSLIHQADIPSADTSYLPSITAPASGAYFWRVGAIDGSCVSYGVTRMVVIGSTTGDINGDGKADLLVGVVGDNTADRDAGAAYVYHGAISPKAQYDVRLTGQRRLDAFGNSVAKVGDVDGDGYADILVGAYLFDRDSDAQDDTGRAYFFWGGPTMSTKPALVFTGEGPNDRFGLGVAGIGDVNGDGFPDIAVGAPDASVMAACGGGTVRLVSVGRVYVYFGGPRAVMDATADAVLTGETTLIGGDTSSACRQGDQFGGRLAGAGDVNGDGYDDLLVGARGYDVGAIPANGENAGRAYLFYGGPWFVGIGADQADVTFTGGAAGDEFGSSVAGAGDTNGDGFADLLVGAPQRDGQGEDSGSVFWYLGGSGLSSTSAAILLNGVSKGDNFGFSVSSARDTNRDGFTDVVIGAYLAGPFDVPTDNSGSATLFLGGSPPSGAVAALYSGETIPQSGDEFGIAVAGPGDVNGDGFDDVAVGAYRNDACCGLQGGDAGRAYLFLGTSAPVSKGAATDPQDWTLTGPAPGDGLGISVR